MIHFHSYYFAQFPNYDMSCLGQLQLSFGQRSDLSCQNDRVFKLTVALKTMGLEAQAFVGIVDEKLGTVAVAVVVD